MRSLYFALSFYAFLGRKAFVTVPQISGGEGEVLSVQRLEPMIGKIINLAWTDVENLITPVTILVPCWILIIIKLPKEINARHLRGVIKSHRLLTESASHFMPSAD